MTLAVALSCAMAMSPKDTEHSKIKRSMTVKRTLRNTFFPNISCAPNYWSQGKPKWNAVLAEDDEFLTTAITFLHARCQNHRAASFRSRRYGSRFFRFAASYLET